MRCIHGSEGPCLRCEMNGTRLDLMPQRFEAHGVVGYEYVSGPQLAVATERERCRAIIEHLLCREWVGNKALEWLDSGKTLEELKEEK